MALRSPRVQTKITQYIAEYFSEEWQTEVSVRGVDIGFFNRLILEGLYVEDLKGDTLTYLGDLHLGLSSFSMDKNQVYLDKIRIALESKKEGLLRGRDDVELGLKSIASPLA